MERGEKHLITVRKSDAMVSRHTTKTVETGDELSGNFEQP
jgi:hypothetical protein